MGSSVGSGLQVVATQLEVIGEARRDKADCIIDADVILPAGATFRKGILYVLTENAANPANGDDLCYLAQQTIVQAYYADTAASITSNLRHALEVANMTLIEANSRRLPQDRHGVGATCLVVRGDQAFIAQTPPAQAYIAHQGQLHYYPTSSSRHMADAPKPTFAPSLGLYPDLEPALYRVTLTSGDSIVLASSNLATRLTEDQIERYMIDEEEGRGTLQRLYEVARHEQLPGAHALMLTVYGDPDDPFMPGDDVEAEIEGFTEPPRRIASSLEGVTASLSLFAARLQKQRKDTGAADSGTIDNDPGPDPGLRRENESATLDRPPYLGRRTFEAETETYQVEYVTPEIDTATDYGQVSDYTAYAPQADAPQAPAEWRERRTPILTPDDADTLEPDDAAQNGSRLGNLAGRVTGGWQNFRSYVRKRAAEEAIPPPDAPTQEVVPEDAPDVEETSTQQAEPAAYEAQYPVKYVVGDEAAPHTFDATDPAFGYSPTLPDPADPESEEWATTPPQHSRKPGRASHVLETLFAPHNRKWIVAVVVVLALLAAAITFYSGASAENGKRKQALDLIALATTQRQAAEEVVNDDPQTALQKLADAQTNLNKAVAVKSGLPEITTEQRSITDVLNKLYRVNVLSNLRLVKDVAVEFGPKPAANTPATMAQPSTNTVALGQALLDPTASNLYVLDNGRGAVYSVNVASGATTTLLAQGQTVNNATVGKPLSMALRLDNVIIVDDRRTLWLYNGGTSKQWQSFALGGNYSTAPRQIESYSGNIYLLGTQTGKSAILRYPSGGYVSAPTAWLGDSAANALDTAVAFTIDGSIYALTADGKLLRMAQGEIKATYTPASDALLVPAVSDARALATTADPDFFSLFVLDGQKRILEFRKSGGFLRQYRAPDAEFGDLRGIAVDEKRKILYVNDTTHIYAFSIGSPAATSTTPTGTAAATGTAGR